MAGAETFGLLSLLPPLLAIWLAIQTRQVYLSLAAGIWLGWTIVADWHPLAGLAGAIDALVAVLADADSARVLLFTFAIGSLIAVVEANGGVSGFVRWVERRRWVTDGRRAQILAWLVGLVIFIESNITILVAGAVSRPLFDRFKVAREKLAYLIDSTSAPVCVLIPFNAWGAYVLGLLAGLGVADPVGTFLVSIPLNFYAIAALLLAGSSAVIGLNWGPMRRAQERAATGQVQPEAAVSLADPEQIAPPPPEGAPRRAVNMAMPVGAMVLSMPLFMWITGGGDLAEGSGSTSVLWAVLTGLSAAWILTVGQRILDMEALSRISLQGAGALAGMALVLLLALALGNVTRVMGTGEYVAGLVGDWLAAPVLLPAVFLASGGISFATGTSWGTFAIMLPVAVPLAGALGLPVAPFVAAVLSGGIFGDHCSPISDTTIISSLAAACDHIDHVRTQLPYALSAAAVAVVAFAVAGALA